MSTSDYSRGTESRTGSSGSAPSLTDTAMNIGSDLKDEALEGARGAQRKTSESMHSFAEAIRKAGDELKEKDEGPVAELLSHAAGGLDQMSRAIGQKRLEDMVTDVRNFGKQHPGAFVMGSVLLGIALGRFAQTAASSASQAQSGSGGSLERSMPTGGYSPPASPISSGTSSTTSPGMGTSGTSASSTSTGQSAASKTGSTATSGLGSQGSKP